MLLPPPLPAPTEWLCSNHVSKLDTQLGSRCLPVSVVPQRAVSCRVPSSPSSLAASSTLWRPWRGTGRWCSAAKPREAPRPPTGESRHTVSPLRSPSVPPGSVFFNQTSCQHLALQTYQTSGKTSVALYRTSRVITSRAGSDVTAASVCVVLPLLAYWPADHVNQVLNQVLCV